MYVAISAYVWMHMQQQVHMHARDGICLSVCASVSILIDIYSYKMKLSRQVVVSCYAKKKQHACTSSGPVWPLQWVIYTDGSSIILKCSVSNPYSRYSLDPTRSTMAI